MAGSFESYAEIIRVDSAKQEVWGPLSTEEVGTDGKVLSFEATVRALERWAGPSSNAGNMREAHDPHKMVGRSVTWQPDAESRTIFLGSRVSRGARDTWLKLEDGVLRYYSIKGPIWRSETRIITLPSGVRRSVEWVTDYDISEVSYVDRPGDRGISELSLIRSADGYTDVLDLEAPATVDPAELHTLALLYRASDPHPPMKGEHTHPHAGYGAPDDSTDPHTHRHSHDDDANHAPDAGHSHATVKRADTTKSEGDAGNFPASDYAYVPDPEKPSTWKLRLTATPGGKPDPGVVGAAAAALGKGYRGNKVEIPSEDRAAVVKKVRAAWKQANPDKSEDDMPDGIQRSDDTPDAADAEISDSGTHGAVSGKHSHKHASGADDLHTHEHTHNNDGDHTVGDGHSHDDVSRSAEIASVDTMIAELTSGLTRMYAAKRNLVKRDETGADPVEMTQIQQAQDIIGRISQLIASEVGELQTEPADDAYGAQLLMCAVRDLQSFAAGEAYEAMERKGDQDAVTATTEGLTTLINRLGDDMNRHTEALDKLNTLIEARQGAAGGTEAVQRGAAQEQDLAKTILERMERLEERLSKTPAQSGPILRTESVPTEKLFPGAVIPTKPEEVSRALEDAALNANDPSVRERAQLASVLEAVRGVRTAAHTAAATRISG